MGYVSIEHHIAHDPHDADWKRSARLAEEVRIGIRNDNRVVSLKIQAIKEFRHLHGGSCVGLKNAKDTVEAYMDSIANTKNLTVEVLPLADGVALHIITTPEGYRVQRVEDLGTNFTEQELRRLIVAQTKLV